MNTNDELKKEPSKSDLSTVKRSCIHCGNTERFETWTELEYNDGADEPHTGGNYLVNVEYANCLDCGESI